MTSSVAPSAEPALPQHRLHQRLGISRRGSVCARPPRRPSQAPPRRLGAGDEHGARPVGGAPERTEDVPGLAVEPASRRPRSSPWGSLDRLEAPAGATQEAGRRAAERRRRARRRARSASSGQSERGREGEPVEIDAGDELDELGLVVGRRGAPTTWITSGPPRLSRSRTCEGPSSIPSASTARRVTSAAASACGEGQLCASGTPKAGGVGAERGR